MSFSRQGLRPAGAGRRGGLAALACALLGLAGPAAPGALAQSARDIVVPVPRVTIYPGSVISEAMLIERSFRSLDGPGFAMRRGDLVGKVARQTLLPNKPVSADGVREPFAVTQGQPAVVVFRAGGLVISGTAIPLQAGAAGDIISLRNTDSGTTIRGIVQGDGTVRVGTP